MSPGVVQVGHLGDDYHTWVHQAIVTKETPLFFENKILEVSLAYELKGDVAFFTFL